MKVSGWVLTTVNGTSIYDDRTVFCETREEALQEILRARSASNGSKGGLVVKSKPATLTY